jgi:hypothetical protein
MLMTLMATSSASAAGRPQANGSFKPISNAVKATLPAALIAGLFALACVPYSGIGITYDLDLVARVNEGKPVVVTGDRSRPRYRDDKIVAGWEVRQGHANVTLRATNGASLRIVWSEAWITYDGTRDAIVPTCSWSNLSEHLSRLSEASSAEIPRESVVSPGGSLSCFLHPRRLASFSPAARVWYSPLLYGRWSSELRTISETDRAAAADVGREFEVQLPLEIDGDRRVYDFKIRIADAHATPFRIWCLINC